jgi:hypothetical protein
VACVLSNPHVQGQIVQAGQIMACSDLTAILADYPAILSVDDIKIILGVSDYKVMRLVVNGQLRFYNTDGETVITKSDLIDYINGFN